MKKGFTLIELLVVISIISLLSSIVLASVNNVRSKARDTVRISNLKQIQTAIELYYSSSGHYPTPGDSISAGTQSDAACWQGNSNWISDGTNFNWSIGYLPSQPHDPIDNCVWPCGNGGATAGTAGTYEYWSNGSRYLLAARFENTSNPARAGVTGVIDPRTGLTYATSWNSCGTLAPYAFVVTN